MLDPLLEDVAYISSSDIIIASYGAALEPSDKRNKYLRLAYDGGFVYYSDKTFYAAIYNAQAYAKRMIKEAEDRPKVREAMPLAEYLKTSKQSRFSPSFYYQEKFGDGIVYLEDAPAFHDDGKKLGLIKTANEQQRIVGFEIYDLPKLFGCG